MKLTVSCGLVLVKELSLIVITTGLPRSLRCTGFVLVGLKNIKNNNKIIIVIILMIIRVSFSYCFWEAN